MIAGLSLLEGIPIDINHLFFCHVRTGSHTPKAWMKVSNPATMSTPAQSVSTVLPPSQTDWIHPSRPVWSPYPSFSPHLATELSLIFNFPSWPFLTRTTRHGDIWLFKIQLLFFFICFICYFSVIFGCIIRVATFRKKCNWCQQIVVDKCLTVVV